MKYYRNFSMEGIMSLTLSDNTEVILKNEDDLLLMCNAGKDSSFIIDGIKVYTNRIKNINFLPDWNLNYIPDSFGYYFSALESMNDLPNNIENIGFCFLDHCINFNQLIKFPSSLKSVDATFMFKLTNFNQPVDLSNTQITSIKKPYFIHQNSSFNSEIKLPLNINETISNDYIITNNYNFTGPLYVNMNFINNIPSSNYNILSSDNPTSNSYTQGIRCKVIDGTFEALHEKLPDLNGSSSRYRKLIEYIE